MKTLLIKNLKKTAAAMIALTALNSVNANNIAVSNSAIVAQNTAANYTHVKFDVSWENSWRTSTLESNWDAAYVFVKYRIPPLNTWHHATLNYVDGTATNDGNIEPAGATINTNPDKKGAFIYRNTNGIGNVNFTGARLRWDYGADGLNDADSVEICVFAVEMVYVPQGAFYAGDGSTGSPVGIQGNFENGNTGNPLYITGEGQLTLGGSGAGSLGNNNTSGMTTPSYEDFSDATSKTLPAAFPKGFNAFYCMKYEITQGQYADFLNKLTLTQATARFMGAYNTNNQSITGAHPAFAADAPDRPLMLINYADYYSYLDWSGLRPMTELEYEKASRGARGVGFLPTADEYAWGDVSIKAGPGYSVTNPGLPNETINAVTTIGNAAYILTNNSRPYRAGAIAASQATPNRVEAGASYYGIMELSGNQWELTMSVGRAESRSFNGTHGDGEINAAGVYDVTNWPTFIWGLGMRGGGYNSADYQLRTSSRQYGHYHSTATTRVHSYGGRGVKTAQ